MTRVTPAATSLLKMKNVPTIFTSHVPNVFSAVSVFIPLPFLGIDVVQEPEKSKVKLKANKTGPEHIYLLNIIIKKHNKYISI